MSKWVCTRGKGSPETDCCCILSKALYEIHNHHWVLGYTQLYGKFSFINLVAAINDTIMDDEVRQKWAEEQLPKVRFILTHLGQSFGQGANALDAYLGPECFRYCDKGRFSLTIDRAVKFIEERYGVKFNSDSSSVGVGPGVNDRSLPGGVDG